MMELLLRNYLDFRKTVSSSQRTFRPLKYASEKCEKIVSNLLCGVCGQMIKGQSSHHVETSQLISYVYQLTGCYMMAIWAFNDLNSKENSADQEYLNLIAVLPSSNTKNQGYT